MRTHLEIIDKKIKLYLNFYLTIAFCQLSLAVGAKIICFYDASSWEREGLAHFAITDLETALDFCTHVVYGFAGINSESLQLTSLNTELDIRNRHYARITSLKEKYPHIKILLSVGGNKDLDKPEKYYKLLAESQEQQKVFIESVLYLVRSYKFDGLDLAFQFSNNKNQENDIRDDKVQTWSKFRKVLTNKSNSGSTNIKHEDYKRQFTDLVQSLRTAFKPHDLMLSLTVLPNINSSMYYNATALVNNLDFINLLTFDFTTPELNPEAATYTAPLYALHDNIEHSVEYEVNHWILQRGVPCSKINIGIASYGRSWKMSSDSGRGGFPIVNATNGPAPPGYLSKTSGLLTWTDICSSLPNDFNLSKTGHEAPLQSVMDPNRRFVTYAFRPADENGEHGMWVSYDDPHIAAAKAAYAKRRNLGGVALFDISLDDFHGICNGDTFPMLRYIKYTFL